MKFVSKSNNYTDKYNRNDKRLEINKKGKGPLVHMKSKKNCIDDLFVLESSDNNEMIKVDREGEVYVKGKKISDIGLKTNENEINLGSWKIISDGDNLLIQKLVGNEWVTKQHFN